MATKGDHDAEPFIDRVELAQWLGTSQRHLRRLVEQHGLPVHRLGRKHRFRRSEVLDWLDADDRARP